jgi:hypothetical protein
MEHPADTQSDGEHASYADEDRRAPMMVRSGFAALKRRVIAASASPPVIERQTALPLLNRVTLWTGRRRVSSPVSDGEKPTTDGSANVDGPPATTSRAVEATADEGPEWRHFYM